MEKIRLASDCSIFSIDSRTDLSSFCCGDSDLDDFFRHDAFFYSKQLLGQSYIAVTNSMSLNTRMMYLDLIDFVQA